MAGKKSKQLPQLRKISEKHYYRSRRLELDAIFLKLFYF